MIKKVLILVILFLLGIGFGATAFYGFGISARKPQIVGFVPYWLLEKADKDYTQYLTTLTYFGLAIDADGKPIFLINPQEEEPGWTALKNGKFNASGTPTSLLVHSADEEVIAQLIQNPVEHAHALVLEIEPVIHKYGFTDLNIDIESFRPASESARSNYTSFVRTIVEDFRKKNLGTITIEIPPIAFVRPMLMDPAAIGAIADFVVLMTYDYSYAGSFTTGAVAPIGGQGDTLEFDVETAVREAVLKIPREKILLGIPLYGYEWETLGKEKGAATIPGGASTASSRRIAEILETCATCSAQFDAVARQPYLIYAENDYFNQIFFENEESLAEKIALAKKYKLGGVALWAIGYEDASILRPLEAYKKSFIAL